MSCCKSLVTELIKHIGFQIAPVTENVSSSKESKLWNKDDLKMGEMLHKKKDFGWEFHIKGSISSELCFAN